MTCVLYFDSVGGSIWAGRTSRRYSRWKLTRDDFDDEHFGEAVVVWRQRWGHGASNDVIAYACRNPGTAKLRVLPQEYVVATLRSRVDEALSRRRWRNLFRGSGGGRPHSCYFMTIYTYSVRMQYKYRNLWIMHLKITISVDDTRHRWQTNEYKLTNNNTVLHFQYSLLFTSSSH